MAHNSITKNYILNLSYQILAMLTPLITAPYISRVLGADGIGIVSYAESIATYFTLFASMGISVYGQREISYVRDSIEKRSIVFWNTKFLSVFTSSFALVVYLVFSAGQKNSGVYFVFALNILNVAADTTWFFHGVEEFGRIVLLNIVFKIINVIYIFLAIRSAEDVLFYALGHTVFYLLSNMYLWLILPEYIQKPKFRDIHPFKDIKVVLSLFIPTIAVQVHAVLGKTMIGAITHSDFENGYYEQALKISRIVLTVITALGTVMIPRIGYHFEKHETTEVKRLMLGSYRFVWFSGFPMCLGLIGIAENFVPWFFGAGYEKVSVLLSILAFLILAIGMSNVTGMQYLVPTKRQKALSRSVVLGVSTNFVLNLILINAYGAIGAAIASVIAEMAVAGSQLYYVRKELPILVILKSGIPYCFAALVMFVCVRFLSGRLSPAIIHTVILIVCGAAIYFGVLIVMKDEFLLGNIKKVCSKFSRK